MLINKDPKNRAKGRHSDAIFVFGQIADKAILGEIRLVGLEVANKSIISNAEIDYFRRNWIISTVNTNPMLF